ncbi:MAG TPA: bifunctional diaminohydroxyphosphoribosylaminopyrimidine deaminase/5-amino-6-(5-phosphoribosylamino)uracil reductase RibD [Polyangiaceae bacterium]|nr:bifunctional diaminohydroxyphosphoribosylaminopyrimidine deaminase/5-amino-6-(5-phosphoribosylamino)uracil reductase RibD [Polyangiaceae bacterium]
MPSKKAAPAVPEDPDSEFMAKAIAAGGKGYPSPNPHVGAVVVKDNEVLAVGHHEQAGEDHAEVQALKLAGAKAKGATLYVTLEPCNHVGRTPPCVDAVLQAKIARVVVGCIDPNPHVEGGGVERLRASGVEVVVGVKEKEGAALIAPWAKCVTTGLPYVSLKLAVSLDGRIATRTGASKWVTGPEARAKVHELRSGMDAVAVGIGTVVADDPRLTVREVEARSPVRVVFDTRLRTPFSARLVATARETATWVITSIDASPAVEQSLIDHGVQVIRVAPSAEGRIDVTAALRALAQRGVVSLMVEGGAELAGSVLAARLADELHVFVSPILLGPRGRPGAVDWAGPDTPSEAPRIVDPHWERTGKDAYVFGRLAYAPK